TWCWPDCSGCNVTHRASSHRAHQSSGEDETARTYPVRTGQSRRIRHPRGAQLSTGPQNRSLATATRLTEDSLTEDLLVAVFLRADVPHYGSRLRALRSLETATANRAILRTMAGQQCVEADARRRGLAFQRRAFARLAGSRFRESPRAA